MNMEEKLAGIKARFDELSSLLASPDIDGATFTKLSKEMGEISPLVEVIKDYEKKLSAMKEAEILMNDETADIEIKQMAHDEYYELKEAIPKVEQKIKLMLIPKNEADEKNAILEVRAGTGGEEAALFAADLFRMYEHFAAHKGWKFEVEQFNETGIGGVKEAVARITGKDVFQQLKFESGVHRVQRVPETEASGRIHTSAATVAVLPEAEEVDIKIDEKDLKIDTFRASGAGGQHINKTDSAIRITHIPTGFVAECQEERSQFKNRDKAMSRLRSMLYDAERRAKDEARASNRKSQVGSGDRSERIRTYNFPQGRVTDHRINLTLYKIDQVMDGVALGEIIDALITEDQLNRLAEME